MPLGRQDFSASRCIVTPSRRRRRSAGVPSLWVSARVRALDGGTNDPPVCDRVCASAAVVRRPRRSADPALGYVCRQHGLPRLPVHQAPHQSGRRHGLVRPELQTVGREPRSADALSAANPGRAAVPALGGKRLRQRRWTGVVARSSRLVAESASHAAKCWRAASCWSSRAEAKAISRQRSAACSGASWTSASTRSTHARSPAP